MQHTSDITDTEEMESIGMHIPPQQYRTSDLPANPVTRTAVFSADPPEADMPSVASATMAPITSPSEDTVYNPVESVAWKDSREC